MGFSGAYYRAGPCANCGREGGGIMGSSAWGHQGMCCREACGKRLAAKIANGMLPQSEWEHDRALSLRIRIKQLQHRVRAAAPSPAEGEK